MNICGNKYCPNKKDAEKWNSNNWARELGQACGERDKLRKLEERLKEELKSWEYYEGQLYDSISAPNLVKLLQKILDGAK